MGGSLLKQPIITFNRVTYAYNHGDEVLQDITCQIFKGDFYFITGESGAGKSTLLKLIYNANETYLGSLAVFGHEMKNLTWNQCAHIRRKIGIVFQEFQLLDHLNVLDNVALPLTLRSIPLQLARDHAAEILSWLGLGNFLYKMPTFLSGGQRQRIAVARAAVGNPEIILADEPTGHVDDANAMKMMFLFRRLHEQGQTIIMATHNQDLLHEFPFPALHIHNKRITVKSNTKVQYPMDRHLHEVKHV